jgi:hypothetical protein
MEPLQIVDTTLLANKLLQGSLQAIHSSLRVGQQPQCICKDIINFSIIKNNSLFLLKKQQNAEFLVGIVIEKYTTVIFQRGHSIDHLFFGSARITRIAKIQFDNIILLILGFTGP